MELLFGLYASLLMNCYDSHIDNVKMLHALIGTIKDDLGDAYMKAATVPLFGFEIPVPVKCRDRAKNAKGNNRKNYEKRLNTFREKVFAKLGQKGKSKTCIAVFRVLYAIVKKDGEIEGPEKERLLDGLPEEDWQDVDTERASQFLFDLFLLTFSDDGKAARNDMSSHAMPSDALTTCMQSCRNILAELQKIQEGPAKYPADRLDQFISRLPWPDPRERKVIKSQNEKNPPVKRTKQPTTPVGGEHSENGNEAGVRVEQPGEHEGNARPDDAGNHPSASVKERLNRMVKSKGKVAITVLAMIAVGLFASFTMYKYWSIKLTESNGKNQSDGVLFDLQEQIMPEGFHDPFIPKEQDELFNLMRTYYNAEKYEPAKEVLETLYNKLESDGFVASDENKIIISAGMGVVYTHFEEFEKADTCFAFALSRADGKKLDPLKTYVLIYQAHNYYKWKKYELAKGVCETALKAGVFSDRGSFSLAHKILGNAIAKNMLEDWSVVERDKAQQNYVSAIAPFLKKTIASKIAIHKIRNSFLKNGKRQFGKLTIQGKKFDFPNDIIGWSTLSHLELQKNLSDYELSLVGQAFFCAADAYVKDTNDNYSDSFSPIAAILCAQRAIEIFEKLPINSDRISAYSHLTSAVYHSLTRDLDNALPHETAMATWIKETIVKRNLMITIGREAKAYNELQKLGTNNSLKLAIEYVQAATIFGICEDNPAFLECLLEAYAIFHKNKDDESFMDEFLKQYIVEGIGTGNPIFELMDIIKDDMEKVFKMLFPKKSFSSWLNQKLQEPSTSG